MKIQNDILLDISPTTLLNILLENSDSFSKDAFYKTLYKIISKTSKQNLLLFSIICDFSLILDVSFNKTDSSHLNLQLNNQNFVILELMFYLYLKVVQNDKKEFIKSKPNIFIVL